MSAPSGTLGAVTQQDGDSASARKLRDGDSASARKLRDGDSASARKLRESDLGRVRRARRMARQLAQIHPDAHCELDHSSPLQLAVATILSAQSTDKLVNSVTP